MRRGERACDLRRHVERGGRRQRTLLETRAQGLSLHILGHHERTAVEFADVVDDDDVRMVERRGGARFLMKPLPVDRIAQLAREELDGDRSIQFFVVREVDLAHAACP